VITGGSIDKDSGWTETFRWDDSDVFLVGQFMFTASPFPFQNAQAGDVINVSARFNGPVGGRGTLGGIPYPSRFDVNGAQFPGLVGSANFEIVVRWASYLPPLRRRLKRHVHHDGL
jgi:hypothetical protein